MKKCVKVADFLKLLDYGPNSISGGKIDDGMRIITFEAKSSLKGKFEAYVEFGTIYRENKGGQYFYFEILDMTSYSEGEFIGFGSKRRKYVVNEFLNSSNLKEIASRVNLGLSMLYSDTFRSDFNG